MEDEAGACRRGKPWVSLKRPGTNLATAIAKSGRMKMFLAGLNYKTAPVAIREKLAVPVARSLLRLPVEEHLRAIQVWRHDSSAAAGQ